MWFIPHPPTLSSLLEIPSPSPVRRPLGGEGPLRRERDLRIVSANQVSRARAGAELARRALVADLPHARFALKLCDEVS